MFTFIGIGLVGLVAFFSNRERSKDMGTTDDYIRYTRRDTRAVMWLLAAVIVMLGIIADRIQ